MTGMEGFNVYILDWPESDADNYVLEDGVQGVNWCKLPIPKGIQMSIDQDGMSVSYFGGDGYLFRYDKTKGIIRIRAWVESRAEVGYVYKFISKRQSAGASPDYLVVFFAANDQLPAYDYDGTDKNGVFRGWFRKIPLINWIENEDKVFEIQTEFHIVWS